MEMEASATKQKGESGWPRALLPPRHQVHDRHETG